MNGEVTACHYLMRMVETLEKIYSQLKIQSDIIFLNDFENIFPILEKYRNEHGEKYASGINLFVYTGNIAPGEEYQLTYSIPEGFTDVADWIYWELSDFHDIEVEWIRDGESIWKETDSSTYKLRWKWFRSDAREYCTIRIKNNSTTTTITAKLRGQCFFLDKRIRDTIIKNAMAATEKQILEKLKLIETYQ